MRALKSVGDLLLSRYIMKSMFAMALFIYGGITLNLLSWISHNNPISKSLKSREHRWGPSQSIKEPTDVGYRNMGVQSFMRNKLQFENKQKRQRKILAELVHTYHENKKSSNSTDYGFKTVGNISVFSAFYDDRPLLDQEASVIRIMGISRLDTKETLVCQYTEEGRETWILAKRLEMTEHHGKEYGGFMYICNAPHESLSIPRKIYVATLSDLGKAHERDKWKVNLNVLKIGDMATHTQDHRKIKISETSENTSLPYEHSTLISDRNLSHANQLVDWISSKRKLSMKNRPRLQKNIKSRLKYIDSIIKIIKNKTRQNDNKNSINMTGDTETQQNISYNISENAESKLIKLNKEFQFAPHDSNQNIAVCIPPLHGNIKLSNFIQFIEILQIQGVSHFLFYEMNTTNDLHQLLMFYENRGVVTRIPWILPSNVQKHIWYHGQVVAVQDCLYRTMRHYNYVAFIDLDELIIPKTDFDWLTMLHRLDVSSTSSQSKSAAFSFKSSLFDPDFMQDSSSHIPLQSKLSFLKNIQRNAETDSVHTKVIVRPEYIIEMGIHHVSQTLNTSHTHTTLTVNTSVALLHHYRECIPHNEEARRCAPKLIDNAILKYETLLNKRYKDIIKQTWKLFKTV